MKYVTFRHNPGKARLANIRDVGKYVGVFGQAGATQAPSARRPAGRTERKS